MKKSIVGALVRHGARTLVLVSILAFSAASASANSLWFVGATFSDGATLNGTFTINSAFNALVSWNVDVTGSHNPTANFDYTNADSNYFDISPTVVDFGSFSFAQYVTLAFSEPMTNGGGTIKMSSANTYDCPGCGTLVAGELSTQPLPEPGTLSLIGIALAGVGLLARKRAPKP